MDFKEAVDLLKKGEKICRRAWDKKYIQFVKYDNFEPDIYEYYRAYQHYQYDSGIILSTGWLIVGEDQPLDFPDALLALRQGKKIRMPDWSQAYVMKEGNDLVMSKMTSCSYTCSFDDFKATDWEIYPELILNVPESKF